MTIRIAVSILALVACSALARAQEAPKPGPEHEKFKALVGDWDCTVKMAGQESKAKATYKLDFGGFYLVENFQGEFGGTKFKGRGQSGYCPIKKKYFTVWIDSMSPTPMMMMGNFDKDGKTLTEEGEGPGHDGKIAKFKSVSTMTDDDTIAWRLTDALVREAQTVFEPTWHATKGDDGYVSFELDPLLEDPACTLAIAERTKRYVELGKQWSKGHTNRMIKVPATPGGLAALESLLAAGVTVNVTLIFTPKQYTAARDAIWRGAQKRSSLNNFKSVYSIFVSRVDVYTEQHVAQLSAAAQGLVGIVNAKRIWQMNRDFWADKR